MRHLHISFLLQLKLPPQLPLHVRCFLTTRLEISTGSNILILMVTQFDFYLSGNILWHLQFQTGIIPVGNPRIDSTSSNFYFVNSANNLLSINKRILSTGAFSKAVSLTISPQSFNSDNSNLIYDSTDNSIFLSYDITGSFFGSYAYTCLLKADSDLIVIW